MLLIRSRGATSPASSAPWRPTAAIAGRRSARPIGAIPTNSAISSQKRRVSTRIYGQLNWTSRSRNDSSLKRPRWVDPPEPIAKSRSNDRAGGIPPGNSAGKCHADGGSPRQAMRPRISPAESAGSPHELRFSCCIRFVPRLLVFAALSAVSRRSGPGRTRFGTEPLLPESNADCPTMVVPAMLSTPEIPAAAPPDAARAGRRSPTEPTTTPSRRAVTGDLAVAGRAAALVRSRQPRARMPRRRASISNRRASRSTGQLAVGEVIANRADSGRFPSSYCGVLFQRSQFSFVRGRSLPSVARSSRQWQTAVAIAKIVDQDLEATAGAEGLVLPRPPGLAGLAAEARRVDRQPHLLPLERAQLLAVA